MEFAGEVNRDSRQVGVVYGAFRESVAKQGRPFGEHFPFSASREFMQEVGQFVLESLILKTAVRN